MKTKPITGLVLSMLLGSPLFAKPPVIVTGWDSPTPAQFRKNAGEFEKGGLFDGTTIKPTRNGEIESQNAFSRELWRWEDCSEALADLHAAKPTACRETFLMLYSNLGDIDWFTANAAPGCA